MFWTREGQILDKIDCKWDGCDRPRHAKGWCAMHYRRERLGKDMDAPPRERRVSSPCRVDSCGGDHYAKGLCQFHYNRDRSGLEMTPRGESTRTRYVNRGRQCRVEACCDGAVSLGLCLPHYRRHYRKRPLTPPVRELNPGRPCSVGGCSRTHLANGMCERHNRIHRQYGLTLEQMVEMDNSTCQICGEEGRLAVDHDHACCPGTRSCGNCVRGFLCNSCNSGLGYFKDNQRLLDAAARYLHNTA